MQTGLIALYPTVSVHYPRYVSEAMTIAIAARFVLGANVSVTGYESAILLFESATALKW